MISLICGIKKNDTNELVYKKQIHRLQKQTHGHQREINQEVGINTHTLLHAKQTSNRTTVRRRELCSVLRHNLQGKTI